MRCEATAEERKAAVATETCVRCGSLAGTRCASVSTNAAGYMVAMRTSNVHVLRIYALRRTRRAAPVMDLTRPLELPDNLDIG